MIDELPEILEGLYLALFSCNTSRNRYSKKVHFDAFEQCSIE